jgi:hypothetical protein
MPVETLQEYLLAKRAQAVMCAVFREERQRCFENAIAVGEHESHDLNSKRPGLLKRGKLDTVCRVPAAEVDRLTNAGLA